MVYKRMKTKAVHVGGKTLTAPGEPDIAPCPRLAPNDLAYFNQAFAVIQHCGPRADQHVREQIERTSKCPLLYVKSGRFHVTEGAVRKKPCHKLLCLACEQSRQSEHENASRNHLLWDKNDQADFGMLTLNAPPVPSTRTGGALARAIRRCAEAVKRLNRIGLISSRRGGPMNGVRWRVHVRHDAIRDAWILHLHMLFRGSLDPTWLKKIKVAWHGQWSLYGSRKTHVNLISIENVYTAMQYLSKELTPIFIDQRSKQFAGDREMLALQRAMKSPEVLNEYLSAKRILRGKRCLTSYFMPIK